MKKITLLLVAVLCFAFSLQSNAQHTFAPAGPVNVPGSTEITVNINDAANAAGVPAGVYNEFTVTVDWTNVNNAWSSEADLTISTSEGTVVIDPPTSGGSDTDTATTLTFTGTLAGDYDPSVDGTLDLILDQSWTASEAQWDNISVTISPTPTGTLDFFNLQWPPDGTIVTGGDFDVYAQAYEAGLTDVTSGQSPGIESWIGYSSTDTDPSGTGWTWVAANFNVEASNNDEYILNLGSIIPTSGTYYYASRWSLEGGPFTYGGILADGSGGGTWGENNYGSGVLTVNPITGEICENPIVISTLPYTTTDDTANYFDNYENGDSPCSSFYMSGDDVVYSFTPASDGSFNVSLTNITGAYSGIHILDGCPGTSPNCVGFQGNSATTDRDLDVALLGGTTYFIVISTWAAPQSTGYTLNITEIACPDPSALTATNITQTSADLGWTENGTATTWDIEWGIDGFTPTGTPTINDTGDNPYNLGGLSAATTYEFYVRADCGSDNTDVSAWSGPFAFTTECDVFTPEYNADMSLNVPDCWEEADNGDAASGPTDFGSSSWSASNHNGTPSNRINLFFNTKSDWIISPVFDLSAAAPSELRVYVALTESTTSGSGANLGSDDEVSLLMTTDGGTSWTALQSWTQGNVPTDVGEQITYDLSAITGTVQFAFLADEGSVNDTEDIYFHVSQFQVRETPACVEPSALTATNITPTSADLGWTAGGTETLWDIELVDITAGGTATGTPTTTGVANPYMQTGLTAENDYEFYVRADCTGGDFSSWTGPFSFTTPCNPETVFPSTTDFTNNPPTSCWSEAGSGEVADGPSGLGASDWKAGRAYTDASAVVINSNVINLWQSVDREWLISPVYNIPVGVPHSLVVNVAVTDYQFSGTSDDTDTDTMGSDDEVQLLQSIDGGTTWTNITTWNVGNQPAVTGTEFIADLTAVSGTIQFALWASDGTVDDTEDYDFHVGEFTVIDNATLSIEENVVFAGFKYFPNPVKGTLSLRAQNDIQNVVVYNMLGQEVLRTSPNTLNSELDMASLQTGAYFVKVTIDDATETIRVIKQ